jgi:hypothetical protein
MKIPNLNEAENQTHLLILFQLNLLKRKNQNEAVNKKHPSNLLPLLNPPLLSQSSKRRNPRASELQKCQLGKHQMSHKNKRRAAKAKLKRNPEADQRKSIY